MQYLRWRLVRFPALPNVRNIGRVCEERKVIQWISCQAYQICIIPNFQLTALGRLLAQNLWCSGSHRLDGLQRGQSCLDCISELHGVLAMGNTVLWIAVPGVGTESYLDALLDGQIVVLPSQRDDLLDFLNNGLGETAGVKQ